MGPSDRAADSRVLEVGRTIDDLAGTEEIQPAHMAEAMQKPWAGDLELANKHPSLLLYQPIMGQVFG